MATTSLWHIKGRLRDLIDYVENPDKTTPTEDIKDFFQVFSYAANPAKTNEGEYVSAINCLKETALQQMILTKQQYGKTGKYIAWHGYQSFKPDELTPKQCHEIGLKLAQEMWGDRYQIIVTTHLDKDHLHNHFCFNSVSYLDGGKYNYSKAEQKRLRDASDRLCREYGLSVINRPKKAPSRPLYLDEKSGKPTRYNVYHEDIREAIRCSNNFRTFEKYLVRKGYEIDLSGAHWKMKLPQYKHFTRMDTLDGRLTPQGIQAKNQPQLQPIRKHSRNNLLSKGNAAGVSGLVSALSPHKPYLPLVSVLLLYARRSARKNSLQTDQSLSQRGFAQVRRNLITGAVYGKTQHFHPLRFTR